MTQAYNKMKKYLIVEDDEDIAQLITLNLRRNDVDIHQVHDGDEALKIITKQDWDLILLDINLPGADGLEICKTVRSQCPYLPVIMITSRDTELDRVLGLELGADDYLTKPFSILELQARIKSVFRRIDHHSNSEPSNSVLKIHDILLNREQHRAQIKNQGINLTAKEFDLLWHLASHPMTVFSRSELLEKVWGYGHDGYEHTVNSHINRLRSKIEVDPNKPEYVQTVWGVGYRFAG